MRLGLRFITQARLHDEIDNWKSVAYVTTASQMICCAYDPMCSRYACKAQLYEDQVRGAYG